MESSFKGHRLSNIIRPFIPILVLRRLTSSCSITIFYHATCCSNLGRYQETFFLSYEQKLHFFKSFYAHKGFASNKKEIMVRSALIQCTFKPILSNFYFELLFSLPLNCRLDFFLSGKKLHSSIFSI